MASPRQNGARDQPRTLRDSSGAFGEKDSAMAVSLPFFLDFSGSTRGVPQENLAYRRVLRASFLSRNLSARK